MTTEAVNPEVKQEAAEIHNRATALQIKDDESMQKGAKILREIKTVRKRVKEVFKPILDAQKEAMNKTKAEFSKYDSPLKTAEGMLKNRLGDYQNEQEQKRKAEEAKLQEQARKQAEEIKLAQAKQLEDAGQKDMADAVLEQDVKVPVVKIEETKAEGVSTRENWSAEVTDFRELVEAVASGDFPLDYLEANQPALNAMARATKRAFKVPGVTAVCKKSVVAKGY